MPRSAMSPTVAIVQRRLTHYRLPLFTELRRLLDERGIALRLLHGDPTAAEGLKNDSGQLDWAEHLPTRYFAGGRLLWQPFAHRVRGCDLVIVAQENKHLNNLPPLLNPWRRQKLAFWGHGRNMQADDPHSLGERFKRWTARRVDWWFAYTEMSAGFVREAGFPAEHITVLNNSIDTGALRAAVARAEQTPRPELRHALGLGDGPMGVFIGSLYADKRLGFLIDAALQLQQRIPGFQLAIGGDGPERERIRQAVARHPGLHWLGPVGGERKAQLLAAADIMLNPGLVGLGILDAFVAGLPMLTTDCGLHSPEIAYLDSGANGLMVADDLAQYVAAAQSLLQDAPRLAAMTRASRDSSQRYSVEAMARRFSDGIQACLRS